MGRQKGWVQGWGRQSCSEWQETGQMPAWSTLALQEGRADRETEDDIKHHETNTLAALTTFIKKGKKLQRIARCRYSGFINVALSFLSPKQLDGYCARGMVMPGI